MGLANQLGQFMYGNNHLTIIANWLSSRKLMYRQGTEVLFMATSDRFPSHPAKESCFGLFGLISVTYRLLDDWLLLYPQQAKHLRFQSKLVDTNSQSRDCMHTHAIQCYTLTLCELHYTIWDVLCLHFNLMLRQSFHVAQLCPLQRWPCMVQIVSSTGLQQHWCPTLSGMSDM